MIQTGVSRRKKQDNTLTLSAYRLRRAGSLANDSENPLPKHPDLFASFPSQAAGERWVEKVWRFVLLMVDGTKRYRALRRRYGSVMRCRT